MPRDYIPNADEPFLTYARNFGRVIALSPEAFDIPAPTVASYLAQVDLYSIRLQAAREPETRGKRTVFLKDEVKKSLLAETRRLAQQIKNLVSVNDDQRQALGLTIASSVSRSIPVPRVAPFLKISRVDGRTVTLEVRQVADRRGKPAGTVSAMVFTHVGPAAPDAMEGWHFAATLTRTTIELPFGPSPTGDTAWFTAFWTNGKGQSGPAARPISISLPAGTALPGEADEAATKLKIAA